MPPIKHATYSASGASHWLTCPGHKVLANQYEALTGRPLVYPPSGPAAQLGTEVHGFFEKSLQGQKLNDAEKQTLEDAGFLASYTKAVKLVRAKVKKDDLILYLEQRLHHPAPGLKNLVFGTSDVVAFNNSEFHVYDLKTGKGQIDANSKQLLVYLSLAVAKYGSTQSSFSAHVLQIDGDELKHREHVYSRGDINNFLDYVLPEAVARIENAPDFNDFLYVSEFMQALVDMGYFTPCSHCKWCIVKQECPLQTQIQDLAATLAFTDFPTRKEALLKRTLDIRDFSDDLVAEAKKRLENGEEIDGLELKASSRRSIIETKLIEALGDAAYKEAIRPLKGIGDLKKEGTLEALDSSVFEVKESYSLVRVKEKAENI